MEEIANILGKLGTESRKFGINYWLIAHSCTQKELKIDRTTLRNCVAAAGYGILTDSSQVANLPQQLVDTGIAEVTARKAAGEKMAGLATSMFEAPYLPPSPLNTVEMREILNPPQQPTQAAPEAPEAKSDSQSDDRNRFATTLKTIRYWHDTQSSAPDDAAIVDAWCKLTGESGEEIESNLADLKKLLRMDESKFNAYLSKLVDKDAA